jgi:putative spermidine/putrescine transport system substrate-binding protein
MKTRVLVVVSLVVAIAVAFVIWERQTPPAISQTPPVSKSQLTVLSFGGTFAEAQRKAYFTPYHQRFGTDVREASYNGEYGKLKATALAGNVPWDVVDVESTALIRGKAEGIFLPIDYNVVKSKDLVPQTVATHGVGADLYSVSLGFNTRMFPKGSPQPRDWHDFWDVAKFPGPRCLKRDARFTLEIALMADGVAPDKLYGPNGLDVDRAFASLDKIKKHVRIWWTTGAQPIQALGDGEVAMAAAFGARMWLASHEDAKPVEMTWNQSIIDTEYWAVLKGAPDPAASMRFIAFASEAAPQAAFSSAFPLGPSNIKALDLIEASRAKDLNTHPDNLKKQVFLDAEWWVRNEAAVTERFNAWLNE